MKASEMEFSLNFQHSYAEQLAGFYTSLAPVGFSKPSLLQFNGSVAIELGLDIEVLTPNVAEQIFSGSLIPSDARPIAQAYAGHQFGHFVPQLGDGRALLLGEISDQRGNLRDVALKGSGVTPFSRGGDGKAAVGPVLREYLLSEAMHALGIPTTRALAAVATGEPVMREKPLPGAVLTRVASSHIRVGTFQYFAARNQVDAVRKLADYVIVRHYPEVSKEPQRYLELLKKVADRQADLIARWMLVGFIHGVMNTDNMAISGETIDYGPCAFMEGHHPDTVFSSIDHAGRYAYGNQPAIALWNLARFAETLLPIIDLDNQEHAVNEATAILETFMPTFQKYWYDGAQSKLGLADQANAHHAKADIRILVDEWFELLASSKVDFTLAWRSMADAAEGNEEKIRSLFDRTDKLDILLERWRNLQDDDTASQVAGQIRAVNPIYIPRNHLVEETLTAATDDGNLEPFEVLLRAIRQPFEEDKEFDRFASPAPAEFTANYKTFCGT